MREYAFMIKPQLIYSCHKCAFSDIAELRQVYIPNKLSIKKSLNLVGISAVIKAGSVAVDDERHLPKHPLISS